MPEGDTIFRAARTLQRALGGQRVTRFDTQYAQLARVHDDAPITGRTIDRVEARGKHLLVFFSAGGSGQSAVGSRDLGVGEHEPESGHPSAAITGRGRRSWADPVVLRTHMLMSGSWHIYRIGEAWQRAPSGARIVLGTAAFVAVAFTVPIAEFVLASELDTEGPLGRLGPDVLSPDFDPTEAQRRLAASPRPTVAEALLEQRSVAGIGNVYKSELLFLARVWPFLPPSAISGDQWQRMLRDAQVLLRANVVDPTEAGVLSYRGMRRTTGRTNPEQRLYVYGRQRQPCRRCGTAIELRHHGEHNRSTYWCPRCQPSPSPER
jgi:endonuclease-8